VQLLESFDGRGSILLTAYLPLDTPTQRESAYQNFQKLAKARLEECGSRPECREALEEDIEIVGLYLKTNGHRQHAGLAIFSCAAELFWRAYPLDVCVQTRVTVGPQFDVEPLKAAVAERAG
jgi:hypothetical protein